MKSGRINSFFLKLALLTFILFIYTSCSKNVKVENTPETQTLEPKKNSERFKNKLSIKTLEDYLQNTAEVKSTKKHKEPFDTLEFDKVIAYDYQGEEEAFPSVIGRNGKFIPIIEKQAALNEKQIDYLIDVILTSDSTYGAGTAACFQPHLGFIFYNKNERIFVTDICLGCNLLQSSQLIPATQSHKSKFEDGTVFFLDGFSKNGKERIRNLATELDFYYSNTNQNMH